jgi:pyruvate dehydrogenase E2 component (dihydrolipoamide acetyltransferase)
MATKITMPRLSDTMTEGTVATWLKKVGDTVKEGDILAEIETDKATMEFESFNSGTLLYIGIKEGETAAVDSLLAIIGKEGEDISGLISGAAITTEAKTDATPAPAESAPAATAEALKKMMVQSVSKGVASNASVSGFKVAGKTGTAENGAGERVTLWFTGFAPATNPRVAIALVIEDGGGRDSGASGNGTAAPVARSFFQAVLR